MNRTHLLAAILFLGTCILPEDSLAVTAYPHPIRITQRDGTFLTLILQGDEMVKWARSTDGYTLIYNSSGVYEYAILDASRDLVPSGVKAREVAERTPQDFAFLASVPRGLTFSSSQAAVMKQVRRSLKSGGPQRAFPTTGNRKLLCILIGFSDKPFIKTQTDFQNLFNQVGYSLDGAQGSVRDFYLESSYDQLHLSVDVAGPFTVSNTVAFYGANDANGIDLRSQEMVTEAVLLADPVVSFANYDNDANGSVDGIYVIFAGYGEESGGGADCTWSHAWEIPPLVCDGKTVRQYGCSPELRSFSGTSITRIGPVCHEFGHVLGAPDFYDINGAAGGQFNGTGRWDLQGTGSWNGEGTLPAHSNPYSKIYLYNWASATTLSSQANLTLTDAARHNNSFYRFNTSTAGEYFLMENRQKVGFDTQLPGHGLMIYHVHKDMANLTVNVTHPQMMYPVCASATEEPGTAPSSYGVISSGGCPFPGTGSKTEFTDATIPSQKSWAGGLTNKPVTNITEDNTAKTITLCFMGCTDPDDPASFTATAINASQINLAWVKNLAGNPVMIAFSYSPVFGVPADGSVYAAGAAIPGGGTVIYSGDLTLFNHTGLASTTVHYYKAWSVLPGNSYSSGSKATAVTSCGDITHLPYLQNFDDPAFPPGCWASFIGTNGLGTSKNWVRTPVYTRNHSAGAAYVQYEPIVSGLSQDWLVTPKITIPAAGVASLRFFQRQSYATDYGTSYSIRISTGSQTDISGFTSIETYGELSFSTAFTLKSLDLTPFAGQQIHIAFVMEQNEGDEWTIDDVTISTDRLLNVKVLIEGAYNTILDEMHLNLGTGPGLPVSQPYTVYPWNYYGIEAVTSPPANVVDWVLVELRDAPTAADALASTKLPGWPKALLLKSDGSVMNTDGFSLPDIGTAAIAHNLYVVVRHRNHLAVMSATGAIVSGNVYNFDFTTGLAQASGGATGYKIAGTRAVMVAGDIDHDGSIFVSDYNSWAAGFGATAGYYHPDLDLDGNVFVSDYNKWASNFGSAAGNNIKSGQTRPKYVSGVPGF